MMGGEKEKLKKEKYINLYMSLAERIAKMSYAKRLQVGSVLVKNDNIISFGWNGMPTGWDNNCEILEFVLKEECHYTEEWLKDNGYSETVHGWTILKSKPEVLHSEANCLMKVSRSTNSSEGASMFITHAPCLECAKMIYQSGIKEVYFKETYRSESGIEFLKKCNVKVIQCEE